jgi:hypothetical protein
VPATVFPSVSNCLSSPPSLSPPVPFRRCARVWCATCERARLRVVRAGPGEPDCQFFVKTGNCRFGESCKFNHPPEKVPHLLHTCCTLVAHLLHTCCTLVASFARVFLLRLSLFAALCVRQSAHGVRPPSLLSLSASRKLVRAHTPGRTHLGVAVPHSLHGLTGGLLLPQTMAAYEHPVREGVPDCTFYIKTGQCKFGSSCKYNHPPQVLS